MKLRRFLLVFLAALLVIGAIPPYAQAAKSGYDMPYYIEVDLTNQIVTIYSTGTDVIVRQMLCSSGTDEAPTPRGTFYLPRKEEKLEREKRLQEAMLTIKDKFGKNAVLKGLNYQEGARGRERNNEVGGHKA